MTQDIETLRVTQAKIQSAFDSGAGHRAISHVRENPHPAGSAEHDAYERGFAKTDAEANAWAERQNSK